MFEWLLPPALAALGFFLGYFYTRSMRFVDRVPERYMTKEDCTHIRAACQHIRDLGREEVLQRLDRLEDKMDRLIQMVFGQVAK